MSDKDEIQRAAGSGEFDPLRVELPAGAITETLEAAARRGKLPGYRKGLGGAANALFEISDFGTPFESVLSAAGQAEGERTTLRWSLRMKPKLPLVFLVVLILTVWPGWWVTDSMIRTYFPSYDFATWKWYVPLTLPFVPWAMWTAIKRSRASARLEAAELIGKVKEHLGASVVR
jgi:hypothetical protein